MNILKRLHIFALIIALSLCWGPSFLFIKLAVVEIQPLTLVACRLLIGGLILWGIITVSGYKLWPYRSHIFHFFMMGIFSSGLPFFLISLTEIYITSSLAAIINSTTPIFTAILAHFFIASDKINLNKGLGIIAGFVGILIVFMPNISGDSQVDFFGASLVLLAAISYAVGMVYSKKYFHGVPAIVCATAQLLAASVMLWPLALIFENPFSLHPSPPAIFGIMGLSILGTATAFPVFYKISKIAGATALSTSSLLFPITGVFLGSLVLNEQISTHAYIGSAVIFSGLAIANGLININKIYNLFGLKRS
jgi:drug/metabolite transporter (DMT)-like permease